MPDRRRRRRNFRKQAGGAGMLRGEKLRAGEENGRDEIPGDGYLQMSSTRIPKEA